MDLEKQTNQATNTENNLYQAPRNMRAHYEVYEENDQTWYHFSGRIGRARYMTYSIIMIIL